MILEDVIFPYNEDTYGKNTHLLFQSHNLFSDIVQLLSEFYTTKCIIYKKLLLNLPISSDCLRVYLAYWSFETPWKNLTFLYSPIQSISFL